MLHLALLINPILLHLLNLPLHLPYLSLIVGRLHLLSFMLNLQILDLLVLQLQKLSDVRIRGLDPEGLQVLDFLPGLVEKLVPEVLELDGAL